MGWSPDVIASLPNDYYEDLIRILNLQAQRSR